MTNSQDQSKLETSSLNGSLESKMSDLIDQELRILANIHSQVLKTNNSPVGFDVTQPENINTQRLESDILSIVSKVLKMPLSQIDPTVSLSSYGVDSIAITELMVQISRFLKVSIAPTTFFEAKNYEELIAILSSRYSKEIEAHYVKNNFTDKLQLNTKGTGALADSATPEGIINNSSAAKWLSRHRAINSKNIQSNDLSSALNSQEGDKKASKLASMPIAIISMEGKFSKSINLHTFEQHLRNGDDCIEEIPPDRWNWKSVDGDPKKGAFTDVKFGGFIPGHDHFDASFFSISPKEAELIDPQHRVFIECVWNLIEGAGYAPSSLSGKKIGIFLGINLQDYTNLVNRSGLMDAMQMTGLGHVFCPNRLSYMLDISGPSQVIDTACSSSLVAIHRAVMSIRHEGCEMAIAGGSNLILTPDQHIMFSKVGMLSIDGRCKTFSEDANGYARADGVGAILLKRLDHAERDGDSILGVIRGSSENHGGSATSLTAPNAKAQAQLIVEAHRQAGFDPRSISMIECHGTGTSLGDPIEIDGLKKSFEELYREHGYKSPIIPHCGIGSVKSNIGHAETAAGVAGIIKILLSMKHGLMYQSLHCSKPNQLIDLLNSPFYLLDKPRKWDRPIIDGLEVPRRAGLSSFGAGGANAHLVLEEYRAPQEDYVGHSSNMNKPYIVPLSARTESALNKIVKNLQVHLTGFDEISDDQLADIAFTLQVGRDSMRYRLAFIVQDGFDLISQLNAYLDGDSSQALEGVVNRKTSGIKEIAGTAQEVASQWVLGEPIQWPSLSLIGERKRIWLPTYPFEGKRFWLEQEGPNPLIKTVNNNNNSSFLLRKIDENILEIDLTGTEFFIVDHCIGNEPVMPGVLYLELIRIAATQYFGTSFHIGQVVWLKPLKVKGPCVVRLTKVVDSDDLPVRIEVSSIGNDGVSNVYAQARITKDGAPDLVSIQIKAGIYPVQSIQKFYDMNPRIFSADDIYSTFKTLGINYGPGHQAIESLAVAKDENGNPQVLAKLHLPSHLPGFPEAFGLHPSLLDGAFQAAVGMTLDDKGESKELAALPFAIESIRLLGECSRNMWVHIKNSQVESSNNRVRTLDLTLMDEQGSLTMLLLGFATRTYESDVSNQTQLFEPYWSKYYLSNGAKLEEDNFDEIIVWLSDIDEIDAVTLNSKLTSWKCISLPKCVENSHDVKFAFYAECILKQLQVLTKTLPKSTSPKLIQLVFPAVSSSLSLEALSSFLQSVSLEYPWLSFQVISLDTTSDINSIASYLKTSASEPQRPCWRYGGNEAEVKSWRSIGFIRPDEISVKPWRSGGIYLITGGAGALGKSLAAEITVNIDVGKVILVGSSEMNSALRDWILVTSSERLEIIYRQVDVSDANEVNDLVKSIYRDYGQLNGVFHLAGVLQDSSIAVKSPEELHKVFSPKVNGVENLDRAIGNSTLDFFVMFASLSGVFGNHGQADYAAANAYLDIFAHRREIARKQGERFGRTLSIDWPLWVDGGMKMDPATQKFMKQSTGLSPLNSNDGFAAVYKSLASEACQVMVTAGDSKRITDFIKGLEYGAPARFTNDSIKNGSPIFDRDIEQKISGHLKLFLMNCISTLLKVEEDELGLDVELTEYGFDSISFTQFSNKLNESLNLDITPVLFFEAPTIAQLCSTLIKSHAAKIATFFKISLDQKLSHTPEKNEKIKESAIAHDQSLPRPALPVGNSIQDKFLEESKTESAVAIIGMSGVFPKSHDLASYWDNLLNGRDCIDEIPIDRWDWRKYWGDPKVDVGRTNVKWGGFLDDIADFDPAFFNISPRESRAMDPQQRILLTQAWRVFEDAGYAPSSLSGTKTGVFIGIADTGYGQLLARAGADIEAFSMTGLAPSLGPNRISYFFNLQGPSEAVETACSSALVAVHRAVESIVRGSCDAAIAGGINTLLLPDTFIGFAKAGMLAPDGRSKPFSDTADGYGRGEGAGLIYLKRLEDAERDGDKIYAVIRATQENHGGHASSLTAPNPKAQADLIRRVYLQAGFDPRTVSYIEMHGTGTPLGDPIEVEALISAFSDLNRETKNQYVDQPEIVCNIGSVKSNIGHLEIAAGIAGLIKTVLQMQHRTIVKTLHCEKLNPYLKLSDSRFEVVVENKIWCPLDLNGEKLPLRAGVSSFGFGGSNAHVVLEGYKGSVQKSVPNIQPVIIVLSAKTAKQLHSCAQQISNMLTDQTELSSLSYSLQVARDPMEYRLGFMAESIDQVRRFLDKYIEGRSEAGLYIGRVKPNHVTLDMLEEDQQVNDAIASLPHRGKHELLLRLWTQGFSIDWRKIFYQQEGQNALRRVVLPGYPFENIRCWIDDEKIPEEDSSILLQKNASKHDHHRYISTFNGDEFFLQDHIVGGRPVVCGAVFLSMVYTALQNIYGRGKAIELTGHTWLQPMVGSSNGLQVAIEFSSSPSTSGINYKISNEGENESQLCSIGIGRLLNHTSDSIPEYDIHSLKLSAGRSVNVEECYKTFSSLGISYGPRLRIIHELRTSPTNAIAYLVVPDEIFTNEYAMHPALLDGAFQSLIGLMPDLLVERALPFSVKRLVVLKSIGKTAWAVLWKEGESSSENASYSIDLCNDKGQVCIRIEGFMVRSLDFKETRSKIKIQDSENSETIKTVKSNLSALSALSKIAAEVLEVNPESLDPDVDLGEYGFDSIMMTVFASRANEQLSLNLTPADFFEFSTLESLARHISDEIVISSSLEIENSDALHILNNANLDINWIASAKVGIESQNISEIPLILKNNNDLRGEPIAIIGISCCFPMAKDSNEFWKNLYEGRDCISEIPSDRWDWRAIYGNPKLETGKTNIRWGGFADGIFEFDALFFGISPREAASMDPQQRQLLQHTWKAIEDAGYNPLSLSGRPIGLFVGTASSGYSAETTFDQSGYIATGSVVSMGPNRVSYYFDWHGPSEPVETACSSSLVAIHRGIQAIRDGECELAIVGGINSIVTPEGHVNFSKAGMLSPDGRCQPFSDLANGYVRGEGAGLLVIKRLSQAERDRDAIYGVVRGSAINHGGRANSLTAPNTKAQADLIRSGYRQSGIDPSTVTYIEAHGTGTAIGDPVEVNALKQAFHSMGADNLHGVCGLGSVKSNIGHLELAAGVAGVIKVLKQMQHQTLVASLHCETQNPYISLENSPFYIVRKNQPWSLLKDQENNIVPRRAGVSSFGFGGVNAHLILEEYLPCKRSFAQSIDPVIIPLSAKNEASLREQAQALYNAISLGDFKDIPLLDIAFTLQFGREHMKCRIAFEVESIEQLQSSLFEFITQTDIALSSIQNTWLVSSTSIAARWLAYEDVKWVDDGKRLRVHLPTYCFAHTEYKSSFSRSKIEETFKLSMLNTVPIMEFIKDSNTIGIELNNDQFYLRDHLVKGHSILPGAMSLEIIRMAYDFYKKHKDRPAIDHSSPHLEFRHIVWRSPLRVDSKATNIEVLFEKQSEQVNKFTLKHEDKNSELSTIYLQGAIRFHENSNSAQAVHDLPLLKARCELALNVDDIYEQLSELGIHYGPTMRSISHIWIGHEELLANLQLPSELFASPAYDGESFYIHPSVLDSAFQSCLGIFTASNNQELALPFAIDRLILLSPTTTEMWAHVRALPSNGSIRKLDIDLLDQQGRVCLSIEGFTFRMVKSDLFVSPLTQASTNSSKFESIDRERVIGYFKNLFSAETGIPQGEIEPNLSLDSYGIDSMMIMSLTDRLEKDFGILSKTIFFECQTLDAVADYFIKLHTLKLIDLLGSTEIPVQKLKQEQYQNPKSEPTATLSQQSSTDLEPASRERVLAPLAKSMDVAIIGLAGRYPGANNLTQFWENLAAGIDSISQIPIERWDHSSLYDPVRGKPGKSNSKWGGFIEDADCFDPLFFNMSPREAEFIDPQERLFLQCAWETIEDAGYTPENIAPELAPFAGGKVGVFVGVMYQEYQLYGVEQTQKGHPIALSSSAASIANRVSYFFNFHGPSMAIDTMCSSSLTSIHLACESLYSGSSEVALAGGVNLSLHQNKYLALGQGRFTSSKGRCESFGKGGDGYVPGEGVGAVLLKPIDKAIADGDHIYGVIKSTAINHGGKTNGYSVPNPHAQTSVISNALARSGLQAGDVTYLEAHGTGTILGDPIEIAALSKAYQQDTNIHQFCALGSVKSNIGHCESAAGIAGLTKILLQIKNRKLAPSIHADILNPAINFSTSPFIVQQHLNEWPRKSRETSQGSIELPRIAGLSSFGAGGSNAHFIIQEYVDPQEFKFNDLFTMTRPGVFPFSARDPERLTQLLARYVEVLDQFKDSELPSIACTLQNGRVTFEYRVVIVASSRVDLAHKLKNILTNKLDLIDIYCSSNFRAEQLSIIEDNRSIDSVERKLAEQWAKTGKANWLNLQRPGEPPHKISLPTYPFSRERYWIPNIASEDISSQNTKRAHLVENSIKENPALLFVPHWSLAEAIRSPNINLNNGRTIIVICDFNKDISRGYQQQLGDVETIVLESNFSKIWERYTCYSEQLIVLIQNILKQDQVNTLLQLVVPLDGERLIFQGLSGLLRTVQLEHSRFRCQLIGLTDLTRDLASILKREQSTDDALIRYVGGNRQIQVWREYQPRQTETFRKELLKDNGVYLITGGTGGVALHVAENISASVNNPILYIVSRSALSVEESERIAALPCKVIHKQIDVTKLDDVHALIQHLTTSFGRLNGIFHAAGITRDKFLIRKNIDDIRDVLAPKVQGLFNIDTATAQCELDFFLLFSSVSGALGNPGQADYAAANGFMDSFALLRYEQVSRGERYGLTLSINWPYWKDGGMRIDVSALNSIQKNLGVVPLATNIAMRSLWASFEAHEAQVLVLDGNHDLIRQWMMPLTLSHEIQTTIDVSNKDILEGEASASISMIDLHEKTCIYLAKYFSDVLHLPLDRLDHNDPIDRYGIDSVLALQIIEAIATDLGSLPSTLLFEYPKITLLANALLKSHLEPLQVILATNMASLEEPIIEDTITTLSPTPIEISKDGIAIISVAGQYPGADSVEEFWEMLRNGGDGITEVPPDRWDHQAIYSELKGKPGATNCKWGGFLKNIKCFDPEFFGINPRDAALMDPQERLLLQTSWHLLERAGYTRDFLSKHYDSRVGVFVGAMYQQYHSLDADSESSVMVSLSSYASMANRISSFYDLQGPSIAIDTMCSSGLMAIHQACQSLRQGECRLAIAGGVNLTIHPNKYLGLSKAGLLGSHQECRSFADGDGYLPSEGVGAVLLKPLSDALRDGDQILAIIRGSATNHGGHSGGYGVPNAHLQTRLISENFVNCGVDPRTIGYVEAAANGSPLGDAIEFRALTEAFRLFTNDIEFCSIGSVKSNVGHPEAASGFAQLTKVILQLENQILVPSIRKTTLNPNILFKGSPFIPQAELSQWKRKEIDGIVTPLRATISAFGAGGTNVHLILEEAPGIEVNKDVDSIPEESYEFIFSSHRMDRLPLVISQVYEHLVRHPHISLKKLARTLSMHRERLFFVTSIIASSYQDLVEQLKVWGLQDVHPLLTPSINKFDDKEKFLPIELPSYPFCLDSYWINNESMALRVDEPNEEIKTQIFSEDPISQALKIIRAQMVDQLRLDNRLINDYKSMRSQGADSMFVTRLIYTVMNEMKISITHLDVEKNGSPKELAALISQRVVSKDGLIIQKTDEKWAQQDHSINTPLTLGQSGLWALQRLYPNTSAYNVPLTFHVEDLNLQALKDTCAYIFKCFPILTIHIDQSSGYPAMVPKVISNPLNIVPIPDDIDPVYFAKKRALEPFTFTPNSTPARFELLRGSKDILLIVVHHIIFDGLSAVILARNFWDAYDCFASGIQLPLPVPQSNYSLFSQYERELLNSKDGEIHIKYWKDNLRGGVEKLQLPFDKTAKPINSSTSLSIEFLLDSQSLSEVKKCTRKLGINDSVFFLGALKVLLYRYTGQNDILIGMPTMARPDSRFENTIGYFANMISIRSALTGSQTVRNFLEKLQVIVTNGLDHSLYPHVAVVRELNRSSIDLLYQVSYAYQNFTDNEFQGSPQAIGRSLVTHIPEIRQGSDALLGFDLFEEGDELRILVNYDPNQFTISTINNLLHHYVNLLNEMSINPEKTLSKLEMLRQSEKSLLVSFSGIENSAGVEDSLVHELVDLQAQLNPDAIALICGKQSLSYQELNVRSNQLAQYLRASGMRLGIPVVVSIERGITSIVLLLAILKNGGIWIPLEVDCPIQRLRTILDDVGRCFVVVDRKTNTRIAQLDSKNCTILNIDDLTDAANHMSLEKLLSIDIPPNSPAYMIYTSGTTGQPKGVLISHQSISTHCRAVIACYDLSNADVVLQFAAHHVDTSLEQIFASLTCGASLLIREGDLWSPNEFSAILDAHLISVADLPPAYLREVLQAWKNDPKRAPRHFPRLLIVGGEILSPSIIDLLRSGPFVGTRLLNAYGPTEATITSSIHEVDLQKFDTSIPIGKPLPGGFIVILDRDGNLVPEGVIGELHIGGVRLANSYHRRSSLNHDRFIPCPVELIKFNDTSDSLLYRTGDLASHVKGGNGTISFHGRVDHQIKIRGFRVELSEIEAVLREFGMLEAAVFSTLSENGEQILHACIVPGTEKFDREELDIFMSERLPTIMCPASYVVCDTLPLTNSGKLDRDFILSKTSEVQKLKNEIYQPSDETEIRLAKLWFEILGKEVLDVHSDFFVEGGNSLMAIRLLAAISSEFDQTLETSALLRASTFLAQAQLLRQGQVSNYDLDSPLVLLAEGEPNMVPLFLIHPVGGDVLCYVPLARALGGKRSIYGLRYIELSESSRFINIEHIAESYVALIRQVQPSGPYQLGGWSLGGVIAYEIAQQLNAAGQQVQMLALIDSYTPSLIEKLELEFKDNVSKQILINPNKHFYLEHPRSKYEVTLSDHLRRYHPKPYHGQVTLFYASDHQPQDLTLGWGELIRSGLTMHALPGHHYSMLEASHLDVLVALLSTDLLTVDFSIDKWK